MSIKLIAFDLDNTLVSSKGIHFEALNFALKHNGYDEVPLKDEAKFDGLPTAAKLNILAAEGKVRKEDFSKIEEYKQICTAECYKLSIKRDDKIFSMLNTLKNMGYKLACVTNSVPSTTRQILNLLEISQFFDVVVTNADGKSKPSPDLYQLAIKKCGEKPVDVLVVEDGERGITAAKAAGVTKIIKVNSPEDLSAIFLLTKIREMSILR